MGSEQPTVLVVEDEPPLVEIYARWLESEYRVRTAQNGSEALEQVDEDVDVALLDRLMPGMSGDEVLAEILDRAPDCRVAMVTAVEPDFDIITMGFDDYLTKPVEKETLLETVDRLLERSDYQRLEQEFYALVSKRSALQAAKSAEELSTSEDFAELEHRIEELETELDTAMGDVDDGEFVAMVRDIEAEGEDPAEPPDGETDPFAEDVQDGADSDDSPGGGAR
ncbi:response regulator [Haloglomus irregulare]|jgi:DNA-binding response OmpR family regulator